MFNHIYSMRFSIGFTSIGLAIVMSLIYSKLSMDYFLDGIDVRTQHLMVEIGKETRLDNDGAATNLGYRVVDHWSKVESPYNQLFDLALLPVDRLIKYESDKRLTPRDKLYLMLKTTDANNNFRYVYRFMLPPNLDTQPPEAPLETIKPPDIVSQVIYLAILFLLLYGLTVITLIWRLTKPIKQFRAWVKGFDADSIKKPVPNFHFSELNSLASLFRNGYQSVQAGVEREKRFLSYVSHELRTPVSASKSNIELLKLVLESHHDPAKILEIQQRLEDSNNTTANLIETFLWLSRGESHLIASEEVDLEEVIRDAVDKNYYLSDGKHLDITVDADSHLIHAPKILCQVTVSNLIRNAFQHTPEGSVLINQTGGLVSVINPDCDSDIGFGLGRDLIRKLSDKYGWYYSENQANGIYTASINFESNRS